MIAPIYHPPILVLEDSDEDFDTVTDAARELGLSNRFQRSTTGDAVLALLDDNRKGPNRPGILILDLNTPGMDGRDALVALRADPSFRSLPIVVMSTSSNPRDVSHCYRHGANAYHVKPVHHGKHLELVREVLSYWLGLVVLPPQAAEAT